MTATATAILTLALMTLGGIVHAAGASLACPDWPLCHGRVLPAMVGDVALEHSHRLLGALVATLAVTLVVMAHRAPRAEATDRRLAWLAVATVAVQAGLGGATVLVQLSPVLSTLHLAVAMVFLAVVTTLAVRARWPHLPEARTPPDRPLRRWAGAALVVLFAQMVLGGLVRHTHAAMACGTDPWLCGGSVWPEAALGRLHMAHRLLAVLVTLLVLVVTARSMHTGSPLTKALGVTACALVVVQVALGVASVVGMLPVAVVAAHLTVATLLWVTLLLLRASPRVTNGPLWHWTGRYGAHGVQGS
jgi:heme A synthase